ncbi:cytochrome P450 [Nonomuraea terrae]|uniref:cytochrome P450 n=1 Tax=Nonomuraea terrae TaxID=2530383 RepID=UPI003788FB1F
MEQCPIALPFDRPGPFDPPRALAGLREQAPMTPLSFVDGHVGWLATGYEAARTVLADPRFSARRELMHVPLDLGFAHEIAGGPPEAGEFLRMDPPEHTRYRRLLIAQFTARRLKQLEPRIAEVTQTCLDRMEAAGSPVDLVREFALPVPSRVICELFGVPYARLEEFQNHLGTMVDTDAPGEEAMEAYTAFLEFLAGLIADKRKAPGEDFFSGLVDSGELSDEELTNIGFILFGAGFETTANMLGLGTFALLSHPDQLALLRGDPSLIDGAVEELLRHLTIIHFGPLRAALEDVEVEGALVRKGQVVVVSLPAANRDPKRFTDPERLDITGSAQGHLTFGYGPHQCLGQQLARIEMRIAFPALLARFPTLRLACAPEDVPTKDMMIVHGVKKLPVAW